MTGRTPRLRVDVRWFHGCSHRPAREKLRIDATVFPCIGKQLEEV
jgi:hypothetical protein